jgi:hypothetical protein
VVSTLSPLSGPATGATVITVTGNGFVNASRITVSIGSALVTGTYVSATIVQAVMPATAAGTVAVALTFNDQQFSSPALSYSFYGARFLFFVSSSAGLTW